MREACLPCITASADGCLNLDDSVHRDSELDIVRSRVEAMPVPRRSSESDILLLLSGQIFPRTRSNSATAAAVGSLGYPRERECLGMRPSTWYLDREGDIFCREGTHCSRQ